MATKLKTVEEAMGDLPPLAKLRAPFPMHQVSKLPKPTKQQTEIVRNDFKQGIRCAICGSWHHPDAIHLDYVGHAALTDRLLDTDINWSWEPVGFTPEGLPALDKNGGLWIKLTVCGVTRYGYGAADGKTGGDAMKEMIGDALRNAAMRFGAALDLWHKGDLHADEPETEDRPKTDEDPPTKRVPLDGPYKSKSALWAAVRQFVHTLNGIDDLGEFEGFLQTDEVVELLDQCKRDAPQLLDTGEGMPDEYEPLLTTIKRMRTALGNKEPVA